MPLIRFALMFALFSATVVAQTPPPMPTQYWNNAAQPPAWGDCGDSDDVDNHDDATGNGPTLGSGTGTEGDYVTWTYDPPGASPAVQYRILRSKVTENQWTALQALVEHHIEFTLTDGKVTDIGDDT